MSGLHILRGCRPFAPKTSAPLPSVGNALGCRRYSSDDKEEPVIEKARSTAEEFLRQAKEKSDSISQTARETLEDAKEAVTGETKEEKEKFKERVEKGHYHNKGQE